MTLFGLFETKTWCIGGHRVKKKNGPIRGVHYECVMCERISASRKKFKSMECYNVC